MSNAPVPPVNVRVAIATRERLPFTTPVSPIESIEAWAQREFIECFTKWGIPFAAHGGRWHYGYGTDAVTSIDAPDVAVTFAARASETGESK